MTVHKAKGLEYPMVILCDNAAQSRTDAPECLVERGKEGDQIAFRVGTTKNPFHSMGYPGAADREKERLSAESVRLYYVAATRARDYLLVPVYSGMRSAGFHAALDAAGFLPRIADRASTGNTVLWKGAKVIDSKGFTAAPASTRPFRISIDRAELADPAITIERVAWSRALRVILERPSTGRVFRSASGLERSGRAAGTPANHQTHDHRRAKAIGVAVHAVLQRIDLATSADIGILSEEEAAAVGEAEAAAEVR